MNYNEFCILSEFNNGLKHGYDIFKKLENKESIKKITLYKIIERLELNKYIILIGNENKRKLYQITDLGKKELNNSKYNNINNKNINFNIKKVESIDSTNSYIKDNCNKLEEGFVICSDIQTKGRGRLQREWISPNETLMFSVLLKPNCNFSRIGEFTQLVAASVYTTLLSLDVISSIKWPNDILVDKKKICGILIESSITNKVEDIIIGIGINLNNEYFDKTLENKATSLYLETNKKFNKQDVLNKILNNISNYYNDFINNKDTYIEICRKNSFILNKYINININNKLTKVLVKDIAADGKLLIEYDKNTELISANEITLENIYE